ncbi:hypothetical protein FOMPIDRAFT_1062548 [Fomitopsis schrenkii]|uniref:CFEM domain-containing protein n=1 Tax=Fomitopsis schrenkii TaxID=2126942 RepID=S8F1Z2_FOMSC|nr:hypothetical protein FOMPIDRAFT_1062548 [Fomitopsis schrenkii]
MHALNTVLVALAIFATTAYGAAAPTTSVLPGYPDDGCIISCIAQAASAANCATYADLPCVCTSLVYQTTASTCLAKDCTVPEITLAQTLHADQCAYEFGISGLSVAASTFRAGASSIYVSDSAEASSLSSAYSSYGSYLSSVYSAYGASLSSDYSSLGSSLSTQFVGTAAQTSTGATTTPASTGQSAAGGDSKTSGAGASIGGFITSSAVVLGAALALLI